MIIEERTKKATRLLLRFLKQKNLLLEFKQDFNPNVKLNSVNIICDKHISLEEFIQIRLNKYRYISDCNNLLSTLIDKTLIYNQCKYKYWCDIESSWNNFFLKNKTFLD